MKLIHRFLANASILIAAYITPYNIITNLGWTSIELIHCLHIAVYGFTVAFVLGTIARIISNKISEEEDSYEENSYIS